MLKGKKVIGLIPARLGSTRLPKKLLLPIAGKPLIIHTMQNAKQSSVLDEVYVVTDSEEIFAIVEKHGGKAIMTSTNCQTGTDRIIEAIRKTPSLQDADYIVNIQGDEPGLDSNIIIKIVDSLLCDDDAVISTAVTPISNETALDPSCVKCVFSQMQRALYFSRQAIPFQKKEGFPYYGHIGVYCFKTKFLTEMWDQLPSSKLQATEDLEQLKVLDAGLPIAVIIVKGQEHGVDTLEDLKRMEKHLCKENIYL